MDRKSSLMPISRAHLKLDKMLSRHEQPIREKILLDPKLHDLNYDVSFERVMRKTVTNIPVFKKQIGRRTLIPGVSLGMIDPTGHGFVDESSLGLEGQGYGMASYKKGLKTASTCDLEKASISHISLKEHREY